jgi:hypothetical protein
VGLTKGLNYIHWKRPDGRGVETKDCRNAAALLHFAGMGTSLEDSFKSFSTFAAGLKGDEKSEAQTFLLHLLTQCRGIE